MSITLDDISADLVLHIIQFLNVRSSGRFAECSQRYYYLVHQYRKIRGPELIASSSWDKYTGTQRNLRDVAFDPVERLQAPPNLVLAFNTSRGRIQEELPHALHPSTAVLGACAQSIQVNTGEDNVEFKSNASVMFASFPDAEILPFCFEEGSTLLEDIDSFQSWLKETEKAKMNSGAKHRAPHWKAVVVYACGNGAAFVERFVMSMQRTLPQAAIVGGICTQGFVSTRQRTIHELERLSIQQLRNLVDQEFGGANGLSFVEKSELIEHIINLQKAQREALQGKVKIHTAEESVFGVVLGGEAPVRSVVTRGVKSTTQGDPQATSPYVVRDVVLQKPDDPDFIFQGNEVHPIHMIQTVYNKRTNETITAEEILTRIVTMAEFIGIKRDDEDGFELHMLSPYGQIVQSLLVMTDGSEEQLRSLEGAEIDFFSLNGDACCKDMDAMVKKLKEQTQGEEILGAVMFSCTGRGPRRGNLIREEMADARRFSNMFPGVPCLGFYAGGEVGPLALAGNEHVFQTGKATVQGFTAVFCLFIVPVRERFDYSLDDCRANVVKFIQENLKSTSSN
eukprot:Nitzschia sp. Nitz4//scaffold387_size12074//7796//9493//NITZ4_009002-RA/size12074-processed-gene-0.5-mRNA-1//1//CDS//3329549973//3057//frame0